MTALLEIHNPPPATRRSRSSSVSASRSRPASSSASWGTTAWARPPCSAPLSGSCRRPPASIRFADQEIARLPSHRRARLGIGYVPQGRQIFPGLSVLDNTHGRGQRRAGRRRARRVVEALPRLKPILSRATGGVLSWRAADPGPRPLPVRPQAHPCSTSRPKGNPAVDHRGDHRHPARPQGRTRASPSCWSSRISNSFGGCPTAS